MSIWFRDLASCSDIAMPVSPPSMMHLIFSESRDREKERTLISRNAKPQIHES